MTTTTTRPASRQQPWPSRREREGVGRPAPVTVDPPVVARLPRPAPQTTAPRTAAPPTAAPLTEPRRRPRHAAPAPAVAEPTERLPMVPAQRSVADARPSVAPAVAVPAPRPAAVVAPDRRGTAGRPAVNPYPPRPVVGSGVRHVGSDAPDAHRVDGRTRHPRNGLGLAALCLGMVGLPLGLVPLTGFLAAGLGVLAVTFGIAGWSRTRSRTATNPGSAATGVVIGLLALALGVVGTVAFFQDPSHVVYDVTGLTSWSGFSTIGE